MRTRTPRSTRADARRFGAEGIGLCRTEHMFFETDRIVAVREMILANDEAGRRKALEKILPMQREDFAGIFRELAGLPVTIRLLDPPLHEFLPEHDEDVRALAKETERHVRGAQVAQPIAARVQSDARSSRLPPGSDVPRDLRDAVARDRAWLPWTAAARRSR